MSKENMLFGAFKPTGCEWTVDVSKTGFTFCGKPLSSHKNSCYCEEHRAKAYYIPTEEDEKAFDAEIDKILGDEEFIIDEVFVE